MGQAQSDQRSQGALVVPRPRTWFKEMSPGMKTDAVGRREEQAWCLVSSKQQ